MNSHLCRLCRSAAVKSSPETVRESCRGKCREISGEISGFSSFLRKRISKVPTNFSRQISRHFSRDVLQLQMPNFMTFFILQTFVLENSLDRKACRQQFRREWYSKERFNHVHVHKYQRFITGICGQRGLAQGDSSHARDSDLFTASFIAMLQISDGGGISV